MAATILSAPILERLSPLRQGFGGGASTVFAIRIAAAAFAYAAQVLAARMMGGDAYGIFATVWVWTALIGHTLTLGLAQGACRFLPEDQARGDADHARGYVRAGALVTGGMALAAGGLGIAGFSFVDVIVLGALASPAELGLYFAATRIQQISAFVQYAVSAAALRHYSAARAVGDRARLMALVRRQGRLTAGATTLVGLGLLAASPLLLALFGAETSQGMPLLAVLVAGGIAASLFGPGSDLLTMLGGERICAAITGAGMCAAVLLCLVLVPVLGPLGAALGMALAQTGRAAALSQAARRLHRLPTAIWAAT